MRALKITENHGLYVVETSAGVRASGASLSSALQKVLVVEPEVLRSNSQWAGIEAVFATIRDSAGGQIAHGQASA